MIKVSKNYEVVTKYLEQQISHCSNRQKTFSYKNKDIYSYNSLLGTIDDKAKVLFIDIYIKSYSNTTAKQTSKLVNRASRNGYKVFYLPLHLSPKKVIMFYWEEVEKYIAKYIRAYKIKEQYKYTPFAKTIKFFNRRTKLIQYGSIANIGGENSVKATKHFPLFFLCTGYNL